jgi:hypothetical protein
LGEGLHRLPAPLHRVLPPDQRADLRYRLGRYRPWEAGFDLSPPASRPGEVLGPPDFVGIGAMMAGTRWWYRLIGDHPSVTARSELPPGRHYLSHFATAPFGPGQVEEYHGWFPRRPGTMAGEWTPSYAALAWVPPLLAEAAPAARLLFMVRDPVERLALGLAATGDVRVSQVGNHMADALDRGFYGAQLRRVLDHVPAERVLILQYERCVADPAGQLAATYRFLGLDDTHTPPVAALTPDPTGIRPTTLDPSVHRRLAGLYADDVADLAGLAPGLDLTLWPSVGSR